VSTVRFRPWAPAAKNATYQKAQVAQSVEQRTENPRVDGSIPPLGTMNSKGFNRMGPFLFLPSSLPPGLAVSRSLQSCQNCSVPNSYSQQIAESAQFNENKQFIFFIKPGYCIR
jgi:hypothetical protein